MKVFKFLSLASILVLMFACSEETTNVNENALEDNVAHQRKCAADEVFQEELRNNPAFAQKVAEIEAFTQQKINSNFTKRLVNGVIEIPVVVNVLYRTSAENISLAQIQSQIDVLNADFNATNADFNNVPSLFSGVKANIGIRFVLDQVIRKSTKKRSWGTNNYMKQTRRGGLNPTSPTTKLNIWCCTIGNGILGYAQFPGGSTATDGVVLDSKYFGVSGTASYPYNLGRTGTIG